MSAPSLFDTSCGETVLPIDLDIFLPSPSTTKPCVSKALYGGAPFNIEEVSSDEWNQPRCWSEPSRYRSAGHLRSGLPSSVKTCVQPESNQTSRMSVTWSKSSALYLLPRKRSGRLANQASAPSLLKASTTRPITSGSRNGSPVFLFTNTAIGTPQARWRETFQSGRVSIIERRRL